MKKTVFTRKLSHLTLGFIFSCFNLFAFQNCKQDYKSVELESVANVITSVPTAPVYANITMVSAPTLFKTSAVNFSFNIELGSGDSIKTVRCQLSNAAAVDCASKSISFNALADGQYQLMINVESSKGAVASQSVSFVKDTTPPVVMVTQAPASVTGSTSAAFVFAAMDNLVGQIQIQCSLNNTTFANCASPLTINNLVAGTHNMKIRATDVAGHVSAVYNYNWTINLTAPTINITSTISSFTNSPTQSISFTGSGVASFQCSLDGAAYTACTSPRALSGLSSAAHTFNVRGVTAAGATTSPVSVAWTVDTVAPTKPVLTANIGATTTSTAASMTFSSTDASSGLASFQCSLDSAAYATCVSPLALSNLTDGVHAFNVRAIDKVGNVSVVSTFSFTVTKPDEQTAAIKVLQQNCNSCHGAQGLGNLSNITDLNLLVKNGYVIPGEPALSKIYKVVVDKTMPPTYVLSVQDQTVLNNWILSLGNKGPVETIAPSDLSFNLTVSYQPHLFRHRLLKVYNLVGTNSATNLAGLLDNRFLLGDYDYSIGVTPKYSLETSDLFNWLTNIESVCRSPSLATKYIWPNGASSFIQTALARSSQSVDTSLINDIQATAATDLERMEILCMTTLTSLEFLSK